MQEAGGVRTVKIAIKAVAFGPEAARLAQQAIGSEWSFKGFLANARQGKSVVFHIQDFLQA
jgi:primosomal replication protein N